LLGTERPGCLDCKFRQKSHYFIRAQGDLAGAVMKNSPDLRGFGYAKLSIAQKDICFENGCSPVNFCQSALSSGKLTGVVG
jgi:hypothetical protein